MNKRKNLNLKMYLLNGINNKNMKNNKKIKLKINKKILVKILLYIRDIIIYLNKENYKNYLNKLHSKQVYNVRL